MDAFEFLKERKRMCKSFNKCSDGCPAWRGSCKLGTGVIFEWEADKQVELVNEWAATHPCKTRQSVFLEQWPEAELYPDGVLRLCPKKVSVAYRNGNSCAKTIDCGDCCRKFWMQEAE